MLKSRAFEDGNYLASGIAIKQPATVSSNWSWIALDIEIMLSSSYFRIHFEPLRNWQQFDLQQRNCSCRDLSRKLQQIDAPQRKHQSGISQFQPLSWAKCYCYFPFPWTNAAARCWLLLWKEFKSFRWKTLPQMMDSWQYNNNYLISPPLERNCAHVETILVSPPRSSTIKLIIFLIENYDY